MMEAPGSLRGAFIWDWVINKVGSGAQQARGLLVEFRKVPGGAKRQEAKARPIREIG